MGRYAVYAVAQGTDPATGEPIFNRKFYNWGDCLPFVQGTRFARYKGFATEEAADVWLSNQQEQRHAYPALKRMEEARSSLATPIVQESTRYKPENPKATPTTFKDFSPNYQSGDMRNGIKLMFSERCMDLGQDPNEILLYLMEQWIDLMDKMGLKKNPPPNEDDEDDLPW